MSDTDRKPKRLDMRTLSKCSHGNTAGQCPECDARHAKAEEDRIEHAAIIGRARDRERRSAEAPADPRPKAKRIDKRTGAHKKKDPSELMSSEEKAEISRRCGRLSDGSQKRGKGLGISPVEMAAIKHLREAEAAEPGSIVPARIMKDRIRHAREDIATQAAEALGDAGFRVRGDLQGDAGKLLGKMALLRMTDAMMGKISRHKIHGVLKASIAVREEVCDPIVKESKITGGLTLESLVSQAGAKAKALKDQA